MCKFLKVYSLEVLNFHPTVKTSFCLCTATAMLQAASNMLMLVRQSSHIDVHYDVQLVCKLDYIQKMI